MEIRLPPIAQLLGAPGFPRVTRHRRVHITRSAPAGLEPVTHILVKPFAGSRPQVRLYGITLSILFVFFLRSC